MADLVEIPDFSIQGGFNFPNVPEPLRFDNAYETDGLFKCFKSTFWEGRPIDRFSEGQAPLLIKDQTEQRAVPFGSSC